jgi:sulfate adenylyltransferase
VSGAPGSAVGVRQGSGRAPPNHKEPRRPDLIPPHGGLSEPLDFQVPTAEQADFRGRAASLKKVSVADGDLSTLYRLGDGGLSPLRGPLDRQTWKRVLDEEVIVHDGGRYAWTIPLAFPVDMTLAKSLKPGETVSLVNQRDELAGSLDVTDVYPFEKLRYLRVP